jgi:hypothetical protein
MIAIAAMPARDRWCQASAFSEELAHRLAEESVLYPISAMLMPAMGRAVEREVAAITALRVTATALAAEEFRLDHGAWPQELRDLVPGYLDTVPEDPFADGRLRCVHGEDVFTIYSIGPDGTDQNGLSRRKSRREQATSEPGYDITFCLLDPGRRGAETTSFADDLKKNPIGLRYLEVLGFPEARLRSLGLSDERISLLATY